MAYTLEQLSADIHKALATDAGPAGKQENEDAAAPPISLMKSRRLIGAPRVPQDEMTRS